METTTKDNRLGVGRFNSTEPAMIVRVEPMLAMLEPMIEPMYMRHKENNKRNRPVIGRFNSIEPSTIACVEPMIELACLITQRK